MRGVPVVEPGDVIDLHLRKAYCQPSEPQRFREIRLASHRQNRT